MHVTDPQVAREKNISNTLYKSIVMPGKAIACEGKLCGLSGIALPWPLKRVALPGRCFIEWALRASTLTGMTLAPTLRWT